MARMSPNTSPSTRRPSVNLRLPSIRVPWAIRLLMGGCAFLPNMSCTPRRKVVVVCQAHELDGLHGTGGGAFHHLGGNVLYHGLWRQIDHALDAAVLAELQRLGAAGQVHGPGLAVQRAGDASARSLPWNSGALLGRLDHQHLPAELRAAPAPRPAGRGWPALGAAGGHQLLEEAQVVAQRAVLGFQHADLRGQPLLRRASRW